MRPLAHVGFAPLLLAVLTGLAAMAGCNEKSNKNVDPNAIACRTPDQCPSSMPLCIDNLCKANPGSEGDLDVDGLDGVDTGDRDADGPPESDIEVPPLCDVLCCSDLECIPPSWHEGDPRWFCDAKGTVDSRCRQEQVCPAQFECCQSSHCVTGKDGAGYAPNPNRCDTWVCRTDEGAQGGTCVNTLTCTIGHQKCAIPRADDPASYGEFQECVEDAQGCLRWKRDVCAELKDCEEDVGNRIECVYSGRCATNDDCIANFECKTTPNGNRCVLHQAAQCEPCYVNGAQVAECDPAVAGLVCCIEEQDASGQPKEARCGPSDGQNCDLSVCQ